MSIKGQIKETVGAAREELGEHMNDPSLAWKGRAQRNEGRIEDGKMPKMTVPGTTHKDTTDK